MSKADELRDRITKSFALSVEDNGVLARGDARDPGTAFPDLDLMRWGVTAASGAGTARVQITMDLRHFQVLESFAKKRRMSNRAALERVLEKFVESGEYDRLMSQSD
ncbi:MAG: hypothetical protein DI556_13480 [Rhodovulum sulfidophilum]|uniref:Uncharacterized protein n=1 Tax=Rhodovulum sulfidophilum TaxID=35806 RepID=A0A2W5N5Q1_RHOSU|nr:MAG: hypothetical protein DI556_13480 [Rhodovulum sulfidophilum]